MEGVQIHDFDFSKLMEFAAEAQGDVFLKTTEGDVLNLKSRLTQLLVLSGAILRSVRLRQLLCGKPVILIDNGKILQDNLRNARVTLDELTATFHISKSYLMHIFREAHNSTPIQYHQKLRISRAKYLLRFTNISITEIAAQLGFEDIHTFSRTFKRIEGIKHANCKRRRCAKTRTSRKISFICKSYLTHIKHLHSFSNCRMLNVADISNSLCF